MSNAASHRIEPEDCALMVVDIQERLMPRIHNHERVGRQCVKLIKGAKIVGVPIVWTEQYRKGLGPTNPEIAEAIGDAAEPLEKMTFGCLADDAIRARTLELKRKYLILCGIESHICVLQTALHALDEGMVPVLVEDAVSSQRVPDRDAALARMRQAGVIPATVEMLLMEWLKVAGTPAFKQALPLLKE